MSAQSHQHPRGLGWLSLTYALYMWTFGTITASLTLFLKHLPHISTSISYSLFATFASLLWTLPIFGGYTAERIGYLRASYIGIACCTLGTLLLCFKTLLLTELGLSFFVIGNAFFTPSLWCLVDHIYTKNDIKRESGFTLFYLCFNILTVAGIFVSTNLGAHYGYTVEYGLCTAFCIITMVVLGVSKTKIKIAPNRSIEPQVNAAAPLLNGMTLAGTLVCAPLIMILLFYPMVNNVLTLVITVIITIIIIRLAYRQESTLAKNKIFGFAILCFFATGFWTLYNIEPSLLSVYIKNFVSLDVFGIQIAPDSLFGFEAIFIVIIGLFTSRLWLYLATRNKDPNLAIKFGLALILIALGFIYLYSATLWHGIGTKSPLGLVIVSYAFFATGELLIGPLGISMVGKLSPSGKEGLFMGSWQLVIGLGAILTGIVSRYSIPHAGSSFSAANYHYIKVFLDMGATMMIAGLLVLVVSPWVKKLLD